MSSFRLFNTTFSMKSICQVNSQSFDVKYRFLGPFWRLLAPFPIYLLLLYFLLHFFTNKSCSKSKSDQSFETSSACHFQKAITCLYWSIFTIFTAGPGIQNPSTLGYYYDATAMVQKWSKTQNPPRRLILVSKESWDLRDYYENLSRPLNRLEKLQICCCFYRMRLDKSLFMK